MHECYKYVKLFCCYGPAQTKCIVKQAVVNIDFCTSKIFSKWLHICEYAFSNLLLLANTVSTNKDYLFLFREKIQINWAM